MNVDRHDLPTLADPTAGSGCRRYRVFVRDLLLDAEIGVHAHERGRRQRVRVNVELMVTVPDAHADDAMGHYVSYEDVVGGIERLVAEGHVNLVETLADRIAAHGLADPRVEQVRACVEKLDIYPHATSVGAEVVRCR